MSRLVRFFVIMVCLNAIVTGLRAGWVDGFWASTFYGACIGLVAIAAVDS